jgi:hypothetical protein
MADGLFESMLNKSKELPTEWKKLLQKGTAAYEIAVLLNATNKLPSISIDPKTKYNAYYSKDENSVFLNPSLDKDSQKNALAHELTHAVRYSMQNDARAIMSEVAKKGASSVSNIDNQFVDAWSKLDPDFSKLPKKEYPDSEYNKYRYSFTEAPAFAVGRMEDPRQFSSKGEYYSTSPSGSHFDATMATEQAILRDLYARRIMEKLQPKQQQEPTSPLYTDPLGNTIGSSIR